MSVVYYAKPCSAFGYYRGSPIYGEGNPYGPECQGIGEFAEGEGPPPVKPASIFTPGFCIAMGVMAMIVIACYLHAPARS